MVAACYRPMATLVAPEKLLSGDVAGMPSFVVNLIRQQVAEPALEQEMISSIETTSGEAAPLPKAGAERPSPTWNTLASRQEMSLGDIMRSQIPGADVPRFAEGPINALFGILILWLNSRCPAADSIPTRHGGVAKDRS